MILKSLHMDNFGLFQGKALEFGPGFNLIFGANESGKTTLVDAIVISLLARTDKKGGALKSIPRSLKHLKDRYGSEISLRVVVNQDDRELDFPDPETFRDRWGIGWDELRAIFIAREGDLELARGDGREFRDWWETLKGKLLGFQEEPRQVLKKIAAEADLTENLGLKEAQQRRTEEIQQKLTWFTDNEQRIHSLRGLEKTYDELKLKEKKLLQEAENTKKGVHKARLLRADEMYRQMKITREKLQAEHGRYTEKDLNEWQKLAGESDKEAAQLTWLRQQKDQEQTRYKDAQTKITQLVRQVGLLSEKLRSAADREQELAEVALQEGKKLGSDIPGWAPWIAWGTSALALILGLYAKTLPLIVGSVMLVALAIGLTFILRRAAGQKGLFLHRREKLLRWGHELGLEAQTLPDLLLQLMDQRKKKDELEGQRKQLQDQLPKLTRTVEGLTKQEKAKAGAMEKILGQIRHLRDRVGLADLEELRRRVQTKTELDSDVEKKHKGGLRALLGPDEALWPGKLEELSSMDQIQAVEDESLLEELNKHLTECRRRQRSAYEDLTNLTAELKAGFGCQKPEEVAWKVADLRRELKGTQILERAGQRVRDIFDRLLQKSDAILDDVIGSETVRRRFQKTTGGKYRSVTMENLIPRVTDDQGHDWDFASLSTGTKDQLLTILRVALAEKRLYDKSFFIFDDALVNSDRTRLREQMQMLGRLTQDGWQILFLTAQDEVRQEAERLTGMGVQVKLFDL